MRLIKSLSIVFLATFIFSSCSESTVDPISQQLLAVEKHKDKVNHKIKTELCGAQEVPAVNTPAKGQFEYSLNMDGTLSYKLKVNNLSSNVLFAHIHIGNCGANGPVAATLFGNFVPNGVPGNGVIADTFLSDADLVGPLAGQTIMDLMNILDNGGAYINVHTVDNPSGEVRGQVNDSNCNCPMNMNNNSNNAINRKAYVDLCGDQEVPPVSTKGFGQFEYRLNKNGTLDYKLKVKKLSSNILFAHIHIAGCGANGPVAALLFGNFAPNGVFGTGTLINGTLSDSDLTGPLAGQTIADLINVFDNGGAYINVHTVNNPSGELRGQVGDDSCDC